MLFEIIISILFTSLLWVIVFLYFSSKQRQYYLEKLNNKDIEFEKEKKSMFEQMTNEKRDEFEKGFNSGSGSLDFVIQVEPYKSTVGKKGYFQNNQTLEIGYVYRLFVKGFPSLDPHIQIVETVKMSELSEQKVDDAVEKIYNIVSKIPSSYLKFAGNLKDFGGGIKKIIHSKGK